MFICVYCDIVIFFRCDPYAKVFGLFCDFLQSMKDAISVEVQLICVVPKQQLIIKNTSFQNALYGPFGSKPARASASIDVSIL